MWLHGHIYTIDLSADFEISDVLSLSERSSALLSSLNPSVRDLVEDDLRTIFRRVLEIAYLSAIGLDQLLDCSSETMQLKALLSCEIEGCLFITRPSAHFWISRELGDASVNVAEIVVKQ